MQAGLFSLILIVRPTFVLQHLAAEAGQAHLSFSELAYATLNMARSRVVFVFWTTVALATFWYSFGRFLDRRSGWESYLLGCVGLSLLAPYHWLQVGAFSHPTLDFVLFVVVLVGANAILAKRQTDYLPVLASVTIGGVTTTLGFIARFGSSLLVGHDPGPFSLVGLVAHESPLFRWLARVDIVDLWWCVTASGGFANAWGRSYGIVLGCTTAVALFFMLFYRT